MSTEIDTKIDTEIVPGSLSSILTLGPPGVGKSHQIRNLKLLLGGMGFTVHTISLGGLAHEKGANHTYLRGLVAQWSQRGELIPHHLACGYAASEVLRVVEHNFQGSHVLLFDGFPRTVEQAIFLAGLLTDLQCDPIACLLFTAAKEVCQERYPREGRKDNHLFRQRWDAHITQTMPAYLLLKDLYPGQTVNTETPVEVTKVNLRVALSGFYPALSRTMEHTD